jgi:hypothetical protein
MIKKERRLEIQKGLHNLEYNKWFSLEKYPIEERAYIIWCIQNFNNGQFESDGISYMPETHTKIRRLNVDFITKLNLKITNA